MPQQQQDSDPVKAALASAHKFMNDQAKSPIGTRNDYKVAHGMRIASGAAKPPAAPAAASPASEGPGLGAELHEKMSNVKAYEDKTPQ
jgi:hypothetical protein